MKEKGRLLTSYQPSAEVIARYQGGDNAGHTIVIDGKSSLHLDSFQVSSSRKDFCHWEWVVINPKSLVKELAYLHEEGVTTDSLAFQTAPMLSFLTISNGPSPRRI